MVSVKECWESWWGKSWVVGHWRQEGGGAGSGRNGAERCEAGHRKVRQSRARQRKMEREKKDVGK